MRKKELGEEYVKLKLEVGKLREKLEDLI